MQLQEWRALPPAGAELEQGTCAPLPPRLWSIPTTFGLFLKVHVSRGPKSKGDLFWVQRGETRDLYLLLPLRSDCVLWTKQTFQGHFCKPGTFHVSDHAWSPTAVSSQWSLSPEHRRFVAGSSWDSPSPLLAIVRCEGSARSWAALCLAGEAGRGVGPGKGPAVLFDGFTEESQSVVGVELDSGGRLCDLLG